MSDEEDTSSMYELVGVEWRLEADEKSIKESKKATLNMTQLIDQLGVAGVIAGKALGKMWEGVQKSISVGLENFGEIETAVTLGLDPKDFNFLKYVVGRIGGNDSDASSIAKTLDQMVYAMNNPATDSGKALADFYSKLARAGVDEKDTSELKSLTEDGDRLNLFKKFADMSLKYGEEYSNIISAMGLDSMVKLEIPLNQTDLLDAWSKRSDDLWEVNSEGLNQLNNGINDFKTAVNLITTQVSSLLGPNVEALGANILKASDAFLSWSRQFEGKTLVDIVKTLLSISKVKVDEINENSEKNLEDRRNEGILHASQALDKAGFPDAKGQTRPDGSPARSREEIEELLKILLNNKKYSGEMMFIQSPEKIDEYIDSVLKKSLKKGYLEPIPESLPIPGSREEAEQQARDLIKSKISNSYASGTDFRFMGDYAEAMKTLNDIVTGTNANSENGSLFKVNPKVSEETVKTLKVIVSEPDSYSTLDSIIKNNTKNNSGSAVMSPDEVAASSEFKNMLKNGSFGNTSIAIDKLFVNANDEKQLVDELTKLNNALDSKGGGYIK